MKKLYVVRFHFGNGSYERMLIQAYTPEEADGIARPMFNEKFSVGERADRGGVAKVAITQVDLRSEENQRYL